MATIVEGEASESDEEVETGVYSESPVQNAGSAQRYSPTASDSSRGSSSLLKSASDGDGVSDVSSVPDNHNEKLVIQQKYKSVFQKKLVEEMFTLRGQAEIIAHKSYNDANKQVRQLTKNAEHLTNDLKKSAYQLQLLTNDLFRLEDKMDEINQLRRFSMLTLPDSLRSTAPQAAAVPPSP